MFLAEEPYPPVSTRIANTFQDFGELEAARALSETLSDDQIVPMEGLLTMSHRPFHLKEKNWPLRIFAGNDYCETPGVPVDPDDIRAWPLHWLLHGIHTNRRHAIGGWPLDFATLRRTHLDEMVSALNITLDNRCTHKCRWLIGPWCRLNLCSYFPQGRCVRPPFHDGECM